MQDDQPDIEYPKFEVGATVWLKSHVDDYGLGGKIVSFEDDIVTVDYLDWMHEYNLSEISLQFQDYNFAYVAPVDAGRKIDDFGLLDLVGYVFQENGVINERRNNLS